MGVPALLTCSIIGLVLVSSCLAGFNDQFTEVWAPENITPDDATNSVTIRLTQTAGAQFATVNSFLYGYFSANIKLVAGNSAGTVSAFYLTSYDTNHDEIDFEFLGNETGSPVIVQTNIFVNGVGGREDRIYLWFDPTTDFHNYSVVWNHEQVTWLVDGTPIRIYKNIESVLPNSYPSHQAMGIAHSIFDGSSWATRGGAVPCNWEYAPFLLTFKDFAYDGCTVNSNDITPCTSASNYQSNWWESAQYQSLSSAQVSQLQQVHQEYQIYDYCTDQTRYPTPPAECSYNAI
ncbi:hypothetical protein R1flu_020557 [Riccia fluitans]|uniref:Xyloglucan endotransglucosylase/hydrolase n=1 Tax=Riccia fluitans TaxID=41844 RepID=A0ABD1ZQK8_9MARC